MILIWSGEGGPLQWLGLVIFCIQFFAPQLIQLSVDIQNGSSAGTPFSRARDMNYVPLIWVTSCLMAAGVTMWIFMRTWRRQRRAQQIQRQQPAEEQAAYVDGGNRATSNAATLGSAANPVVIEDNINQQDGFNLRAISARFDTMLQSLSPAHFMLALGFALPLIMSSPLILNLIQNKGLLGIISDSGFIQISALAVAAHSVMIIAAYRVLRDVLDSGGVGGYPGNNRQGGRRRRWRKLTVSEISDIGMIFDN